MVVKMVVRTYHTLVAKTQRQAERARVALIVELELLQLLQAAQAREDAYQRPLARETHRMLCLAMQVEPKPLGFAVEITFTMGMRLGEVCALRWSYLYDDGTIR